MFITASDWSITYGSGSFKSFNGKIEISKFFINPKIQDNFIQSINCASGYYKDN